jgi:NAD(P)-dependent dehydrogenase (short-subunit alcohol dehydrogenase family)
VNAVGNPRDEPPDTLVDPHGDASPWWLPERVAIVTGGGLSGRDAGVGYAISRLFARHGARVAVVDRVPAAAGVTVEQIRTAGGEAFAVTADVSRDEDCQHAVRCTLERYGGVDILVNNVAAGDRATLFEVTPQRWHELVTLNLTTAWLMTHAAVPAMSGGGAVVNISSVAVTRPGPGTVYAVAKAGVENLTRGAASLLGPSGIRVNCVQLGEVWTSMAARALPAGARDARRLGVALKTEGTAWDAAYAALFLASERARWVSGHVLTVDGGGPHRDGPATPSTTPEVSS